MLSCIKCLQTSHPRHTHIPVLQLLQSRENNLIKSGVYPVVSSLVPVQFALLILHVHKLMRMIFVLFFYLPQHFDVFVCVQLDV